MNKTVNEFLLSVKEILKKDPTGKDAEAYIIAHAATQKMPLQSYHLAAQTHVLFSRDAKGKEEAKRKTTEAFSLALQERSSDGFIATLGAAFGHEHDFLATSAMKAIEQLRDTFESSALSDIYAQYASFQLDKKRYDIAKEFAAKSLKTKNHTLQALAVAAVAAIAKKEFAKAEEFLRVLANEPGRPFYQQAHIKAQQLTPANHKAYLDFSQKRSVTKTN